MKKEEDDIPVSDTDEMTTEGGPFTDRTRKLGEYRPTNMPLSAEEISRRQGHEWEPRTTQTVEKVNPLEPDEEEQEDWPDGA